ncbi:MAG TPA: enoyl-CoA hydratase-related protein [Terracidiphilus sp.]|nr:enoyl-CoA hydratase-related protein [Terracidiphilus sp.]
MDFKNILIEKRSPLAVVTLNRPEVRNALNGETLSELGTAFNELGADSKTRVILLTGAGGRAFAAGADIRELASLTAEEAQRFALRGQGIFRAIEQLGKPVIACIQGFALGGGCELAMSCTLRIAADDARLGQPEVKLGIMAGYGGSQRLPRLVGRGAALKLLLTGSIIDAQEALRIGLVDEVVPAAQLVERAESLAREIAANAPLAITETLRAVDEGLGLALDEGLKREATRFGQLCSTSDKAKGTEAFLAKRAPVWKGQ